MFSADLIGSDLTRVRVPGLGEVIMNNDDADRLIDAMLYGVKQTASTLPEDWPQAILMLVVGTR